ncbi:MAG: hypothetical protein WC809_09555 [Sinimarinibacterium sp.]|jgi:hypothetical protein
MRHPYWFAMLCLSFAADAVDRVELSVGRIEGADWRIESMRADWRTDGAAEVELGSLTHAASPVGPARVRLRCPLLRSAAIGCDGLAAQVEVADLGTLDAVVDLSANASGRWRADLRRADLLLSYNSADGRIAADQLHLSLQGRASAASATQTLEWQLRTLGGQAYVEPAFFDFGVHPLRFDGRAIRPATGPVRVERLQIEQTGIGTLTARGEVDPAQALAHHRVAIELSLANAAAAAELYLRPFLATTPLHDLELAGTAALRADVRDGALQQLHIDVDDMTVAAPGPAVVLNGLNGALNWQTQTPVQGSVLRWREGVVGRIPLGAAQLDFATAARDFALTAPARLPVLDGALELKRFVLSDIGNEQMGADVQMQLLPIDLPALCRALGWPEFAGTLAGTLPGLRLRERRLDIDGTLTAAAFDGQIEVRNLSVIEPFGPLPRVKADLRLRRLDLAAVTGAFDFGRITGRLDGDFDGLRLIGWEPVAMNARLYSSADDDSPRRISQRAIDSISSIGGGPTGLLSRGFFSVFDDFAYARIGWSCVLDNGVCRMNGIGPAKRRSGGGSNGYVLVQGRGLPRIDVVGYSTQVSWPVFLAQLKGIGKSGPAQVSSELR